MKYLVSYAAEGDVVPGLKAMVPGGAFVKEINKTQQGQPGAGTNWYVISSNFHVKLFDDSHHPPEFPRELVVKLAEGFVDRLFGGDNDLVVDVSSMDAIDSKVGGFVRDGLALGENDTVYHTNYFSQLKVIEALAGWLPLGLGAGGGEVAEGAEPPAAAPTPHPPAAAPMPEPPAAAPMPEPPAGAPRSAPSRPRSEPPSAEAEQEEDIELTRASLAAEMPAHVVAKQEFAVRVRLSRNAIEATAGTTHEERRHRDRRRAAADRAGDRQVQRGGRRHRHRPLRPSLRRRNQRAAVPAQVQGLGTGQGDGRRTPGQRAEHDDHADRRRPGARPRSPPSRRRTSSRAWCTRGSTRPSSRACPASTSCEREERSGAVVFQYALRLLRVSRPSSSSPPRSRTASG